MRIRDIPIFEMQQVYDYADDAEREVNGFIMRGGLWHKRLKRVITGTLTSSPTSAAQFGFNRQVWFIHRVIFSLVNGAIPESLLIDHKDRDRSHNRIANLRALSPSQNQMNRSGPRSDSSLSYLGVCVSGNRFAAFVTIKSQPVHLGNYDTAEDAARRRDDEGAKMHGGYATLNRDLFPQLAISD